MTREELIQSARKLYDSKWPNEILKKVLEENFPELKESEDERIGKELLNHLRQEKNSATLDINREKWSKMLVYLERLQKEQKPTEYLDKDMVYAIMNKLHDLAFSQLIPINSDEYKKIDEITGDVRRLLDYPIEQKPAEWSEEDEEMFELLRACVCRCINDDRFDYAEREQISRRLIPFIERLKSLPKRFNLPLQQKWSEEDEEIRRIIINRLTKFDEWASKQGYTRDDPGLRRNPKDWLKSLRPQPHWKPSEEQMDVLKNCAYSVYRIGDGPALRELYEQLKKL